MGWAVGGITGFFVFRLFVCFETVSYPVAQARMRHHALFSFKIYYHYFSLFPLAIFFETVLLCSPGLTQTYQVAEAGPEFLISSTGGITGIHHSHGSMWCWKSKTRLGLF